MLDVVIMDTEFIKVESNIFKDESSTLIIPDTEKLRKALLFGRPQVKKPHACPQENCGAVFSKPSRLKTHLNIHLGKRPFPCAVKDCEKAYFKATSLRRHVMVHHTNDVLPKSLVPCSYPGCQKSLSSVSSLKKHLFRHLNSRKKKEQKPIRCAHCDAIFERLCDFNRHMRGHKTYLCDIENCGQLFQRRAHLRTHLATCHPADHICSECNKRYKSRSKLKVHLICHMNEEDKRKIYCPFENCTRAYSHKQNLNHHIKIAHEGKRYECPLCNKLLTTKKILERHMKVHKNQPCTEVDVTYSPVHKYPYMVDSLEESLEQQELLHKAVTQRRTANNQIAVNLDDDSSLDEYTMDAPQSTFEPEVNLEESFSGLESDSTHGNFNSVPEIPYATNDQDKDHTFKIEICEYTLSPNATEVQPNIQMTEEVLDTIKQELCDPDEGHVSTLKEINTISIIKVDNLEWS